jgi:methyl-accepting chemotaxis protein
MRVFSGLSIRLLLGYVLGLLGLMLLLLGGARVFDATSSYNGATRLAAVTEAGHSLFGAMQNLRFERGGALAALAGPGPVSPEARQQIVQNRGVVDQRFNQGTARLAGLQKPELLQLMVPLTRAFDAVATLRPKIDAAMSLPKAERDAALAPAWAKAGDSLLHALDEAVNIIDSEIRMHDAAIDALLVAKRAGWVVRTLAGDESALVSAALSARKPWTPAQLRTAAEARGHQAGAWEVVNEVATRTDASHGLKAAVARADEALFGKGRESRQPIYDSLNAGGLPEVTGQAWQADMLPVLAVVGMVCDASLNDMGAIAAAREADALRNVVISAIVLFTSLLLIVAGFLIVQRRVSGPITRLTAVMGRLAERDFAVDVPSTERADELGAMARTVRTFRENGLTMLRLETEAAEQRRLVEAERAQAAAQQAERVAQQTAAMDGLAAALTRMARGDLTCEITKPFASDYERIRLDFNAAVTELRDTVSDIATRTATIRTGTQEIASAADDLARRTERQAAGLEQTAAALQQITSTVLRTAEGGQEAKRVVSTAESDAERARQVAHDAVSAMGAIETSARQITQIIGVIDEIAFQTNLLALNAGVEAARAGESGRGFAVVAAEVRALAQRSADAAKQIKDLIKTSSQQVGRGVALVDETGQSLGRILQQVNAIGNVIGEIASAAQEQATGLREINTAVSEMDHVTQQNAAMVEQTTAATHSLRHETEQLSGATARFHIETETATNTRHFSPSANRLNHAA